MQYAEISTRKLVVVLLLVAIIASSVYFTAIGLKNKLGAPSISAVGTGFEGTLAAWWYRVEYNAENIPGGILSGNSFLAAIGIGGTPKNGANVAAASGAAQAIPVLLYHGILSKATGPEDVTVDSFKDQMFTLKADGWQTVTLAQFQSAMAGDIKLPPKSFLLTFDDGRKESYYPVDPVLQALGYHAVMFVIAGHALNSVGDYAGSYYLSTDELLMMKATGRWDIESHSYIGHDLYPIDAAGDRQPFYANKLWLPAGMPGETSDEFAARVQDDLGNFFLHHRTWDLTGGRLETDGEFEARVSQDLLTAKNLLESKLGVTVTAFAYPFNDFAQSSQSNFPQGKTTLFKVANQVYPLSFYQWSISQSGYSENYPSIDTQLMRRIELTSDTTAGDLIQTLDGGEPKTLPFQSADSNTAGWVRTWGMAFNEPDGTLNLKASTSTTGALALLDGTELWKNYEFDASINWTNAQNISIIGYFNKNLDAQAYLECSFSNGAVDLRQNTSDGVKILTRAKDASIISGANQKMGINFVGGYVECLWNGGIVATAPLPANAPRSGGPSIEAWSPTAGQTSITVKSVSVKSN